MAAVRQVGTEKGKLTKDMAQQIEKEVAETNKLVSERNRRNEEREQRQAAHNEAAHHSS